MMQFEINPDIDDEKVWKGFRFPMGAFMVWSKDGRMAWGKSDPFTKEILEWNECNGKWVSVNGMDQS